MESNATAPATPDSTPSVTLAAPSVTSVTHVTPTMPPDDLILEVNGNHPDGEEDMSVTSVTFSTPTAANLACLRQKGGADCPESKSLSKRAQKRQRQRLAAGAIEAPGNDAYAYAFAYAFDIIQGALGDISWDRYVSIDPSKADSKRRYIMLDNLVSTFRECQLARLRTIDETACSVLERAVTVLRRTVEMAPRLLGLEPNHRVHELSLIVTLAGALPMSCHIDHPAQHAISGLISFWNRCLELLKRKNSFPAIDLNRKRLGDGSAGSRKMLLFESALKHRGTGTRPAANDRPADPGHFDHFEVRGGVHHLCNGAFYI